MTENLLRLSTHELREIASAIKSGRLAVPFTSIGLERYLAAETAAAVVQDLEALASLGFGPEQIAPTLEMLVADRSRQTSVEDAIDLVTTGPEVRGVTNRDTSVVVQELFRYAQKSVLLAGYAVYQGQQVFQTLADRMQERPDLQVRLFLDIQRKHKVTTMASEIVRGFVHRFRRENWPTGRPLPEVYYDPRSLEEGRLKKTSLHAKCVVVDSQDVFISSANFTEAAQDRNIEVGILVRSRPTAERLTRFFEAMVADRRLERIIEASA